MKIYLKLNYYFFFLKSPRVEKRPIFSRPGILSTLSMTFHFASIFCFVYLEFVYPLASWGKADAQIFASDLIPEWRQTKCQKENVIDLNSPFRIYQTQLTGHLHFLARVGFFLKNL